MYAVLNKMMDSVEIIIKDTNVVRLNQSRKNLIAKDTGSTYVIYKYRDLRDTMFVYIYSNSTGSIMLPVKLTYFTLNTTNCNNATLQWQTSQEQNSKGFSIEQSTNGVDFNTIGFVPSQNNGNSSTIQNYNFNTTTLSNGKIYFRLKQIDNDGRYEYSNVINTNIKCATNNITITPNPASKFITLQGLPVYDNHIFKIYDAKGSVILKGIINPSNTINVEQLATGIYYLKLDNGEAIKFIKN